MGDGELAEGSNWEGAAAASHHRLENLLVFVDRNQLQICGPTIDVMNYEPLDQRWASFGWGVRNVDGHDLDQIYDNSMDTPFEPGKPSVIIADTVKSKGLSFAEDKLEYHYWKATSEEILEALLEVAEENPDVVALSADSSSGSGLKGMAQRFPERHFEFGIMEQGVIGYASGLATIGKIPFVAAIAPFVTARPFEMVRNDLGYMRQNVKVVGRSSGLTYSDLGATHQSLDDIAMIRTIPGFTVVNPGDPMDVQQATHAISRHIGPVYMKIGRQPMPVLHGDQYRFELGKAVLMRPGLDVTIIGTGTVLSRVVEAADILEQEGIHARVLNVHTIKPLDTDAILGAARDTGRVITVEEGYTAGGLGGAVSEFLGETLPTPILRIGVDDAFASNGPYEELLGLYGLLGPQIAGSVQSFLEKPFLPVRK